MSLREYRARYKTLDRNRKTILGFALILALVGVGASVGGHWRGDWNEDTFTLLAPQERSQTRIYELVEYDGAIYGGTGNSGYLFRYIPGVSTTWTRVASQLSPGYHTTALLEYNGVIYGGMANGYLYSYTPGVSGWTKLTPTSIGESYVRALVEYNGIIYGGTEGHGRLYSYTPGVSTDWTLAADTLNGETVIETLAIYNGVIYAGTGPEAWLFSYTPGESTGWTQLAGRPGINTLIHDLQILDGTIYASSQGKLLAYTIGVDTSWRTVIALGPSVTDLAIRGDIIYGVTYGSYGSFTPGQLVSYTPGDSDWTLVADTANSGDAHISILIVDDIVYSGSNSLGGLYGYMLPALPEPDPEPDPGLDTGGLLTIGSFWCTPTSPKVDETVAWKITGVGITRAAVEYSIVDALTGEITTNTENLMYSDGVWWATAVYNRPCRIVATPYVYGESGSVNGTAIVLEVLPETSPASSPGEAVSIIVEETINTVFEAGEVATRFMISTTDWSGADIPMWVPTLVLLVIVVLVIRRQQQ